MHNFNLLENVKVIELSYDVGAAYCGQLLASQAANVVRLLDSDKTPATYSESLKINDEYSAAEISLERAKKRFKISGSNSEKTADIKNKLIDADIFVTDYMASELAQFGISPDEIKAQFPKLIIVHITSFGSSGPYADWIGGDLETQAFAGTIGQLGPPNKAPLSMPYKAGLIHAGIHGAANASLGLYKRSIDGKGIYLDIAAAQASAGGVRGYSLMMRYYDVPLKREGRRPPGSLGRYPTAIFQCKDGYVVMTSRSSEQTRNMIEMMGNPAWADEPRYKNAYAIAMEYPDEVDALIHPWLMARTRAQLAELGLQYRFPIGVLKTLDEVMEDEQFEHRDFFETIEIDGVKYKIPGIPSIIID